MFYMQADDLVLRVVKEKVVMQHQLVAAVDAGIQAEESDYKRWRIKW